MNTILQSIPAFLLIFVRITAFFVTAPVFSNRSIPTMHKIGFSFFVSYIVFFMVNQGPLGAVDNFIFLLIKEVIVGLSLGIIASIVMSAIQVAGGLIDFSTGFSMATIFDPQTGVQSPLMGQFFNVITILFLLSVNAHYLLLQGILNSFKVIPIFSTGLHFGQEAFIAHIIQIFMSMFVIAFQMALPVVASLFLVDVALGILTRIVPQLNIFVVGMPLKVLVAFGLLIIGMPTFIVLVQHMFELITQSTNSIIQLIGGMKNGVH
ncbi:flagellar type III secretion system protein FliR [Bacillus sp. RG28]|uniref:Flagellar biosynthetic protein FliR n=1 Tax=Gottfriedia endophytica TaxID=2820819 RepID=A0A940NR29_9BACI|nr:flagellar biosynthetic protein FliR [Gottfriedia endophytica]MBP0726225.1 flagellar type III secretion system protein FliR [Gottfriedia endophytica]